MDKVMFNAVFGIAMCSFPVLFVSLAKTRAGADEQRIKRLLPLLWASTLTACTIVWYLAPVTHLTWVLFFPLWFGLGNPIWLAKNPGLQPSADGTRVASLKSREVQSPIPITAWYGLVVYVLAGAMVLGLSSASFQWGPWLIWSGSLLWLSLTPWAAKAMLREPEPLDASGSEELQAAYEKARNRRAWGFYGLGFFVISLFQGAAIAWALGKVNWAIWIGAGGGSLGGVAGGVFGTMADLERARVAELKHALDGNSAMSH